MDESNLTTRVDLRDNRNEVRSGAAYFIDGADMMGSTIIQSTPSR